MRRPAALTPLLVACLLAATAPAAAQLRGHGGPVRAVAVPPSGDLAVSGGFDATAIVWSLDMERALAVLRFHESAVNAVAALLDGRFATGGEDGRIALWRIGRLEPEAAFDAHNGPVSALSVSPDGRLIASSSWDRTVRVMSLDGGAPRAFEEHRDNVNGVAFTPDGKAVVSAGYDAALRLWPLDGSPGRVIETVAPLNALAMAPDGTAFAGAANGAVFALTPGASSVRLVVRSGVPVTALAVSPDGASIAFAGPDGAIGLVTSAGGAVEFLPTRRGAPVWSLAFARGGGELLAGGGDRFVRRFDLAAMREVAPAAFAEDDALPAGLSDHPGAKVFRACQACHTLTPDGGTRAGPSLHGVMGRGIGAAPGYAYSDALRHMDVVWSKETIARLFEIGPALYTPGTKMPEQTIPDAEDRRQLVDFIAQATR